MKINKQVLVGFLKKAKLDGKQIITETNLKFDDDGLKIDANAQTQQIRVMAWLKKEAFTEYENFGNVGINDVPNFIRVLERFDEKLILKKEGNILTIKAGTKKVDVELVAESFLSGDTGEPKLEFTETFQITATALKDIFKDVQMNENALMTFETEEKKLKVSNTGKYKFKNVFECPPLTGGSKVVMGTPLIEGTQWLDGNLEINIKTDYPMKVQETTDNSIITLIVAPRVEDEE